MKKEGYMTNNNHFLFRSIGVNVLFFIVVLFLPGFIFADDNGEAHRNLRISAVSITGLKRTKPHVAQKALKKFIGMEAENLNIDDVKAAVIDTGILDPLEVEVIEENNEAILHVTVREKWSIFPIPMIMAGSNGFSFGGFFGDMNAFGLRDIFFVGGMYSKQEWMVTGGYMHNPRTDYLPGWRLMGMFARQERHDTDQNKNNLRVFDLDSFGGSGGLSYAFFGFLNLSVGLGFEEQILKNKEEAQNGPIEGGRYLKTETNLSIRKSNWDGYLLSQQSISLGYEWTAGLDYDSFHSLSFRGIWEKSLLPGFRLNFKAGGIWSPDAPVLQESSPFAAQVNILPSGYKAKNFAGTSLGLEKYIFKFSFGTLSALLSWQAAWSDGSILKNQFDQGIAGGISFYMSKLAIPALTVGGAYNITAHYFQGSFSLGMSF
ncbi:hypothetical protein [Leadbettera azotonutricia]|uniref:POTRA domain-containing protein n=1 Tax=Leadbettera azotonutricia (strain ATCC BAA-888 / DSM 13862 / ZAS-9) TaxID=545695 RepID=F5YB71_LEAAZ|nr:hypothetical protein [Leadbettera azotonutricia]AEF82733.1 hypothetical protein TREAZ_2998 [Leadbettera azotonutricia ZAS-9]